jgi:hypothetical protein
MIRKTGIVFLFVIFFIATALAVTVTVDDVIKLHQEGLSIDVIKSFIETSGQTFDLGPEDLLKLNKAGVPEDIIKVMLETKKKAAQENATPPPPQINVVPVTPSQPSLAGRILGIRPGEVSRVIVEPNITHQKKFTSVFYLCVYQKKLISSQRVARIGRYDPLRNTADRAGTIFLTDTALLVYDENGVKRYELPYKEIMRVKITNRYPDDVEARFHPLDRYQLRIEFDHEGKPYFMTLFTLPAPENPDPNYGNVTDIVHAVVEAGRAVNPRLAEPKK